MVSNIVILSMNRDVSRKVAEMLSEELQMHFLDTIELFEFDNIPHSFSEILEMNGESYFRKKEKGLLGYVCGFENTVIHAESGCVLSPENIKAMKENCLVIYLHLYPSNIKKYLGKKEYESNSLKLFYDIGEDAIKQRVKILKKDANIQVDANKKSFLKTTSDVLRAINEYYLK